MRRFVAQSKSPIGLSDRVSERAAAWYHDQAPLLARPVDALEYEV
jgi:hypothetical protein